MMRKAKSCGICSRKSTGSKPKVRKKRDRRGLPLRTIKLGKTTRVSYY